MAVRRAVGWEPGAGTRLCFAFNSGFLVPLETETMRGQTTQNRSGAGLSPVCVSGCCSATCPEAPLLQRGELTRVPAWHRSLVPQPPSFMNRLWFPCWYVLVRSPRLALGYGILCVSIFLSKFEVSARETMEMVSSINKCTTKYMFFGLLLLRW